MDTTPLWFQSKIWKIKFFNFPSWIKFFIFNLKILEAHGFRNNFELTLWGSIVVVFNRLQMQYLICQPALGEVRGKSAAKNQFIFFEFLMSASKKSSASAKTENKHSKYNNYKGGRMGRISTAEFHDFHSTHFAWEYSFMRVVVEERKGKAERRFSAADDSEIEWIFREAGDDFFIVAKCLSWSTASWSSDSRNLKIH